MLIQKWVFLCDVSQCDGHTEESNPPQMTYGCEPPRPQLPDRWVSIPGIGLVCPRHVVKIESRRKQYADDRQEAQG